MFRSRCISALIVVALLAAAAVALPELVLPGILSGAPALLLLGCLWLGRYPGHERIVRWITRRRRPRRRTPGRLPVLGHRPVLVARPRGGRLLGSQLAVRPPPGRMVAARCV